MKDIYCFKNGRLREALDEDTAGLEPAAIFHCGRCAAEGFKTAVFGRRRRSRDVYRGFLRGTFGNPD